jgi:hypothetical protein
MWSWFFDKFQRQAAAKVQPMCKDSTVDCYPSQSNPGKLCPNGYCFVHCVCYCRSSHERT